MIRDTIVVHHSLTKDSGTVSWAAIERFHRETNGWADTGYHAGLELVADLPGTSFYSYQALIGRAIDLKAAACPQGNMNERGLHVCCVGNFDDIEPSNVLLERLVERVIRPWMRIYHIHPDRILGHRDFNSAKSCPGRRFDLERVRRMVR